jgi:predicted Zn-dependent peptidase
MCVSLAKWVAGSFSSIASRMAGRAAGTMCYRETQLENGVRIITHYRKGNTFSMRVWINSGSAAGPPGVAHFAEHMLFGGTGKKNAEKIREDMKRHSLEMNACTTRDYFALGARGPLRSFGAALDMSLDMAVNSAIPEERMEVERKRIREEERAVQEIGEERLIENAHAAVLLGSYREPVLGHAEEIEAVDREQVKRHMESALCGENVKIIVSGEVPHKEVVERVRRSGEMEKIKGKGKREIESREVALAFRYPGREGMFYPAVLLQSLLGSYVEGENRGSLLDRAVRKVGIRGVDEIKSMYFPYRDEGLLLFLVRSKSPMRSGAVLRRANEVKRVLEGELRKGIPRRFWKGLAARLGEYLGSSDGQCEFIGEQSVSGKEVVGQSEFLQRLRGVTSGELGALFKHALLERDPVIVTADEVERPTK